MEGIIDHKYTSATPNTNPHTTQIRKEMQQWASHDVSYGTKEILKAGHYYLNLESTLIRDSQARHSRSVPPRKVHKNMPSLDAHLSIATNNFCYAEYYLVHNAPDLSVVFVWVHDSTDFVDDRAV